MAEKFFLISQVFYPDQVSTASLFTDICSVLAGKGIDVEVWTAHPSYTEKEKQPSEVLYKGIRVKYLRSTNFRKDKLPGRLLNIISFTLSSSIKLLFSSEKAPVWTHTTPPLLGFIISSICRLKKRKFVYILLDILPEGLIRLKKLSRGSLWIRFWQWSFEKTLTNSSRIIVLGRDMLNWVTESFEGCFPKTSYVPHWHDDNIIYPIKFDSNPFLTNERFSGRFVVQYCGNMGLWNDMAAIGRAVSRIPDVFFVFTGDGMRKKELTDQLKPGTENYIIQDFQPKEKLNMVLCACHAHIVSLGNGLEGMAVPSKIYGILASGRPVIAMVPDDSEIAMVVREEECGIITNPSDTDGLIKGILILKEDEELRRKYALNSRNAFEKKYTTKIIAEIYMTMIHELTCESF